MKTCTLKNNLSVFKALGSHTRAEIFTLIQHQPGLNIKQIAQKMNIPVTTLSPHLNILREAGLIRIIDKPLNHGIQKCCFPEDGIDQICIDLISKEQEYAIYSADIPIGHYTDFDVTPTCGIASPTSFIGPLDQPRSFAHPNRYQAKIAWFTTGYLEYILPNFIPQNSLITELSLAFEISSECPRTNNYWPSDITFSLNGHCLGTWISPGDFGDRKGHFCPEWWYPFLNQYGLMKKLTVNSQGTFMDDEKLSDVSTGQLALNDQSVLKFRFSVFPDAPHPGGCTLFGAGFGDYSQNIRLTIGYRSYSME